MDENTDTKNQLFIGTNAETGEKVFLPTEALVRHIAIFGQSGSGKTVACKIIAEEAVRNGIPVIIIDPQGDISSLPLIEDWEVLEQYGIPKELYEEFKEKLEVVIFTPASEKGVPLSINPLRFPPKDELEEEELIMTIDGVATTLVELFDYRLSSTKGKAVKTYLISLFESLIDKDILIEDFDMLKDFIEKDYLHLPASKRQHLTKKEKQQLIRTITYFTVGAQRLIFSMGPTLSIESLIRASDPNKVRVSIINLKTLEGISGQSHRMKDTYISTLAQQLYFYVKKNPRSKPQILFYIDEVASLMPPHPREPPTKRWLKVLFKEGRKFGLSVLAATQNISDVDYKAIGQAKTYLFGQFSTKQDIENVRKILLEDHHLEISAEQLKTFKVGHFWFLCPEFYPQPVHLKTRRLYTKHVTLSVDQIEQLYEESLPTLSKKVKDYYAHPEIGKEELAEKLTIQDIENELQTLKDLAEGTASMLGEQADSSSADTETAPLAGETQTETAHEKTLTEESKSGAFSKELYDIMPEIKEHYLKYEAHNIKELHKKFFEAYNCKFLTLEEQKIVYIPVLYVELSVSATRQIKIDVADTEQEEDVTLELVESRAFPLIDYLKLPNGEKIWDKEQISIATDEVFEELINILPMKNLSSLIGAPSADIIKIPIQRNPQQVFETFQDILLHDAMFYTIQWKEAINKHISGLEGKYRKMIDSWTRRLKREREELKNQIIDKRQKVKKFQAQIEEAKAVYTTLKPVVEGKYGRRSSTEVSRFKKAREKIEFGPKVVRKYIDEIEDLLHRIKEIDAKITEEQKIVLKNNTNDLLQQKAFVLPKPDELTKTYASIIYIPADLITYRILDDKGRKLRIRAISEAVLGSGMQILCDECYDTQKVKLQFVDSPRFCSVCGKALCENHGLISETTKELLCPEHAVTCVTCNKIISKEESETCIVCNGNVCADDVKHCSVCGKALCEEHAITKEVKAGLFKTEERIFCPEHVPGGK